MRTVKRKLTTGLAILSMGLCANFVDGCLAQYQIEAEVLAEAESNPTLINDSYLVDWFGPQAIKFFQKWW